MLTGQDKENYLALQRDVATLQAERDALESEAQRLRVANRLVPLLEAQLQQITGTPDFDADVEQKAVGVVAIQRREQLEDETAEDLVRTRGDEVYARLKERDGPALRTQLHERFGRDGTYDAAEQRVRADFDKEVRNELIAEKEQEVRAELDTPEGKAAYKEGILPEVLESDEMDRVRRVIREELERGWRGEAVEEAKELIHAQEEARQGDFMARERETYLGSWEGRELRERIRGGLEREWRDKSREEIAEALQDEELQRLLNERAERAKQELEKKNRAEKLLADFEGAGLDVTTISTGSRLVVYLGSYGTKDIREEARYGGYETKPKLTVTCLRKLELVARGEGKFKLLTDSLHDSDNPWVKESALDTGTVLTIGDFVSEDGTVSMHHTITADAPFCYDTDSSDPEFTATPVRVANIAVDGVSARKVEVTEYVKS
jgi:hypothetical protein